LPAPNEERSGLVDLVALIESSHGFEPFDSRERDRLKPPVQDRELVWILKYTPEIHQTPIKIVDQLTVALSGVC
jgi:hypothetical protein